MGNVRPRGFMVAATLAAVLAAGALAFQLIGRDEPGSKVSAGASGEWRATSSAPLSDRWSPAMAWTGVDVFVFGGTTPSRGTRNLESLNDGASYDIAADKWEPLPAAPFSAPLQNPIAQSDSRLVVVVGELCSPEDEPVPETGGCAAHAYSAASFNLDSGKWAEIEVPTFAGVDPVTSVRPVGASGGRFVFRFGQDDGDLWVYDADAASWNRIDPPVRTFAACVANGALQVLTGDYTRDGRISEDTPLDLEPGERFEIRPGDGWTNARIAQIDLEGSNASWRTSAALADATFEQSPPLLACVDAGSLVLPSMPFGRVFSYTPGADRWSAMAPIADYVAAPHKFVGAGDDVVLTSAEVGAQAVRFRFSAESTDVVPEPVTSPQRFVNVLVGAGDDVAAWTNPDNVASGGALEILRLAA